MSFSFLNCGERKYLRCDAFVKEGFTHAFTTKLGGVSRGEVAGFNLGFRVGDKIGNVKENYRLLAEDLGLNLDKTVLAKQTHTKNIRAVTETDGGKGILRESDIEDTDGLVTDKVGMPLVVFSADCVPILIADVKTRAVAAIHSGWRGTVRNIAAEAVKTLEREYDCKPENLIAAIGPSIGPCCFEAHEDCAGQFESIYVRGMGDGKFKIDLWSAVQDRLKGAGVSKENIYCARECTVCKSDTYYSYRVHREHTGRLGAVIMR